MLTPDHILYCVHFMLYHYQFLWIFIIINSYILIVKFPDLILDFVYVRSNKITMMNLQKRGIIVMQMDRQTDIPHIYHELNSFTSCISFTDTCSLIGDVNIKHDTCLIKGSPQELDKQERQHSRKKSKMCVWGDDTTVHLQ